MSQSGYALDSRDLHKFNLLQETDLHLRHVETVLRRLLEPGIQLIDVDVSLLQLVQHALCLVGQVKSTRRRPNEARAGTKEPRCAFRV